MRWCLSFFCVVYVCAMGAFGYAWAAELPSGSVCFSDRCVTVEIVEKPADLVRGLQFRQSLPAMTGMLFIMPKVALHSFWMKDTLIALDMIWLNESRQIVFIERDVPPCSTGAQCPAYAPDGPARYILELNAGEAYRLGLAVGDEARFVFSPRQNGE